MAAKRRQGSLPVPRIGGVETSKEAGWGSLSLSARVCPPKARPPTHAPTVARAEKCRGEIYSYTSVISTYSPRRPLASSMSRFLLPHVQSWRGALQFRAGTSQRCALQSSAAVPLPISPPLPFRRAISTRGIFMGERRNTNMLFLFFFFSPSSKRAAADSRIQEAGLSLWSSIAQRAVSSLFVKSGRNVLGSERPLGSLPPLMIEFTIFTAVRKPCSPSVGLVELVR